MDTKIIAAAVIAIFALVFSAAACNNDGVGFSCPAGQVVEYDDDGYECESDANNNGVDDEEDD